jgi:hypothetical protein
VENKDGKAACNIAGPRIKCPVNRILAVLETYYNPHINFLPSHYRRKNTVELPFKIPVKEFDLILKRKNFVDITESL